MWVPLFRESQESRVLKLPCWHAQSPPAVASARHGLFSKPAAPGVLDSTHPLKGSVDLNDQA